MSRLSQMFWYMQEKKKPTPKEKETVYTAITITDELEKQRKQYQKEYGDKEKIENGP